MKKYINNYKIDIIISLILNLRVENFNTIKFFLFIYSYQISKYNCLDKNNIDNINKNIIIL